MDYSVIGERIKAHRKEQKKTQEMLAEVLSVSVGYISQIERGATKINLEILAGIALELDCDIGELVSGVASPQAHYLDRELDQRWSGMTSRQKQLLLELSDAVLKY